MCTQKMSTSGQQFLEEPSSQFPVPQFYKFKKYSRGGPLTTASNLEEAEEGSTNSLSDSLHENCSAKGDTPANQPKAVTLSDFPLGAHSTAAES